MVRDDPGVVQEEHVFRCSTGHGDEKGSEKSGIYEKSLSSGKREVLKHVCFFVGKGTFTQLCHAIFSFNFVNLSCAHCSVRNVCVDTGIGALDRQNSVWEVS